MNNEEIIKRIYSKIYSTAERFLDEYGRIRESRFREFCFEIGREPMDVYNLFRMNEIIENGITFFQPSALDGIGPTPIPELTTDQEEFLDNMAAKVMVKYFDIQQPMSWEDSMKIARLSYTQALAMLNVKENGLQELITKNNLNYKV